MGVERKHAFKLKTGEAYLGWLGMEYQDDGDTIDLTTDYLYFSHAPSPFDAYGPDTDDMDGDDEKIPLSDIDLESLAYWDYQEPDKGWQVFQPSDSPENRV
jgi:hypothetical protein